MRAPRLLALAFVATSVAPLFASVASVGCSSSDSGGSGTTDTGTGNPCEGLGCESAPGTLVVKVHDVSGADVASPTFTEKGAKLSASCPSPTDTGAGLCASGWSFGIGSLSLGPHTIDVTAPGFDTQTIDATIQGPAGCCGIGPEVDRTVILTPINSGDAGGDGATDASDGG
jgi:hypothetical protein